MRRRVRLALFPAVFLFVVQSCARPGGERAAAKHFEVKSEWVGEGTHSKPYAVVFVHGIFGSKNTWGSGTSAFPELLASDPAFSATTDVFTFRYYSPQFGSSASVPQLVSELRGALEDQGVLQHKHLIFVSHSMGGIIVRQFLVTHTYLANKVALLYFYATPTNGSDAAVIARKISFNSQLRALLPYDSSDLLQSISDQWDAQDSLRRIPSHCAYETLPTDGVLVVSAASARALCNRQTDAISANHVSIVKPDGRDDPRYTRFATALRGTEIRPGPHFEYLHEGPGKVSCTAAVTQKLDGSWREETLSPEPCSAGSGFNFEELRRDRTGIILFDAGRHLYARLPALTNGSFDISQSSVGPWGSIHQLRYVQTDF